VLHFARPALATEFDRLRATNFPLVLVVERLCDRVRAAFGRVPVVTCVFRTLRAQATTHGGGTKKIDPRAALHAAPAGGAPRALLERRAGPHLFGQAVDLSISGYSRRQLDAIVALLRRWDRFNRLPGIPASGSRTVYLHDAGSRDPHLHVQYAGPPVRLDAAGVARGNGERDGL